MFMNHIRTSGSIVEKRKEVEYVIWELIYELYISCKIYKGIIKFYELISIYCVQ